VEFEQGELTEWAVADCNIRRAEESVKEVGDRRLKAVAVDVNDVDATARRMSGYDVVINATVPLGSVPTLALKAALKAGVNILDLGAFPEAMEDGLALDKEFERAGLTAIQGFGSSPGIMSVIARALVERMDRIDSIDLSFAYISKGNSTVPFKIPFSGALYEFVATPLVYRGGEFVNLPAMSGVEDIDYPDPIGRRRCFSIGHGEVLTFPSSFKDKGLKNVTFKAGFTPEFFDQGVFLYSAGLLNPEPVEIQGAKVCPIDLVTMCAESLPPEQGRVDDYGISRVVGRGTRDNARVQITGIMLSYPYKGLTSAQHRTGHAPAIGARMIVRGDIVKRGVFPPEIGVDPSVFFRELARKELDIWVEEKVYA